MNDDFMVSSPKTLPLVKGMERPKKQVHLRERLFYGEVFP